MEFMDLFRPKWKHSDLRVRKAAVAKLTDQRKLYLVVTNDHSWEIQEAALSKIDDQARLADIVAYGWGKAREAATSKLTDQTRLADLAQNDGDVRVRVAAYRKLGNEQAAKREIEKETEMVVWCEKCQKVLGTGDYRTDSVQPPSAKEMEADYFFDQSTCNKCRSTVNFVRRNEINYSGRRRIENELRGVN
ncbi:MAG: hypothetical protein A4E61_00242 [Syntrophorhabdus sp. PtaB.Bin184]|nr:MAG: hypothetical protein A4E61_00242 [Syntrophorhabdus sp. PtaB.Bin184]